MLRYRAEYFVGALLLGAALRIVAYPLPGSTDSPFFHVWSHASRLEGVGHLYGTGGRFPERRLLVYDGVRTKVDYPPLALEELGIAPPKVLAIAADVLLTSALYLFVRRRFPEAIAQRTALAIWLNPAVILLGAVLGYLDALYLAPALLALLAAATGGAATAAIAGALLAAACLTKPLAILIAPAVGLALWSGRDTGRVNRPFTAVITGVLAATLIVLPVIVAGGFLNMLWGVGSVLRDPFVSGAAANLWWLAIPAVARVPIDLLRVIGALATVLAIAWAASRTGRTSDAFALAAFAAFSVHAYELLAVSVHENHLAGVLPFLALASAADRRRLPVLAAVSVIAALNMNVFYGFGVGVGWAVPRTVAGIDIMFVLAMANVATFAWHARTVRPA